MHDRKLIPPKANAFGGVLILCILFSDFADFHPPQPFGKAGLM